MLALLFPGQGSQYVGMGSRLARAHPEAAATFRQADDTLGFELSKLMWEGPEDDLVLTMNAQPAILTHSVAALRVALERLGEPSMAAGHSLGEYSAHVAAGTLSFEEALEVVRLRGSLMAKAGDRAGTMAAVLGMGDDAVEGLCEEASNSPRSVVVPANFNSEGQVVISGDLDAVDRAVELAPQRGAKRVVRLTVSGAFHSPLMQPAEAGLRVRLETARFQRPRFPIYTNVDARPVEDGESARARLVRQLTLPVRWSTSIREMAEAGATRFVELGPGSVLTGLNRRNARGIEAFAIGEPEDLAALIGAGDGASLE